MQCITKRTGSRWTCGRALFLRRSERKVRAIKNVLESNLLEGLHLAVPAKSLQLR